MGFQFSLVSLFSNQALRGMQHKNCSAQIPYFKKALSAF